jgi:GntR family transcriptional regulator/MocR family aminotransferase
MVTGAVLREFADQLELIPSETGLHVAALARKASVEQMAAVAARAADLGVAVQVLSGFAVGKSSLAGLVLGYGAIETGRIRQGLRRLKSSFKD